MNSQLLEKPLDLLTEEDIAQITREECRRFLKDRGMRRPSWNKSQAIQQVISLKALLEERSDPGDLRVRKGSSRYASPWLSKAGGSPYRRKDAGLLRDQFVASRGFVGGDLDLGQLTIFYGGIVNVYDGVPSAKARDIMELAADPLAHDDPKTVAPASFGLPFLNRFAPAYAVPSPGVQFCVNTPAGKLQRNCKDTIEEEKASRELYPECPTSRKASLKRYLDKRKDRYKGRRIIEGSSSSSMELMYLSQKFSGPGQNEHSSRSNSSSSMQPRLPCLPFSRCTSVETKKFGLSVDLNDDGAGGN